MAEMLGLLLALLLTGLWLVLLRLWRALRRRVATHPRVVPVVRRMAPIAMRLRRSRAAMRREADRSAALAAEVIQLRVALRMAERERARAGPDDRFTRAKRAFAMRFHPDRILARGLERAVRISIFREFWAELRRIERS